MLDGEVQLLASVGEVAGGVGPGVQVGAAAQGLTGVLPCAFGHMMYEDDGDVMLAIELTQETQKAGDVGGTVFVEAVEAHEGVE